MGAISGISRVFWCTLCKGLLLADNAFYLRDGLCQERKKSFANKGIL